MSLDHKLQSGWKRETVVERGKQRLEHASLFCFHLHLPDCLSYELKGERYLLQNIWREDIYICIYAVGRWLSARWVHMYVSVLSKLRTRREFRNSTISCFSRESTQLASLSNLCIFFIVNYLCIHTPLCIMWLECLCVNTIICSFTHEGTHFIRIRR